MTIYRFNFNFVFGSEEYNEYVDQFNDVFGFFVDGNNIGVIPGTTTPVTVNSINNYDNNDYYVNNDVTAGRPYNIEYDGFTTVLEASLLGLEANETHHIKLAIADSLDYALYSGVFIQASSFSDNPTPTNSVPEPSDTVLFFTAGLLGFISLKKRKA